MSVPFLIWAWIAVGRHEREERERVSRDWRDIAGDLGTEELNAPLLTSLFISLSSLLSSVSPLYLSLFPPQQFSLSIPIPKPGESRDQEEVQTAKTTISFSVSLSRNLNGRIRTRRRPKSKDVSNFLTVGSTADPEGE